MFYNHGNEVEVLEDFVEKLKRFVKTPVALCTNVFLHKESLVDDIRYRKSLRQVFDPVTPTYVRTFFIPKRSCSP